jgi:hypothetical protein
MRLMAGAWSQTPCLVESMEDTLVNGAMLQSPCDREHPGEHPGQHLCAGGKTLNEGQQGRGSCCRSESQKRWWVWIDIPDSPHMRCYVTRLCWQICDLDVFSNGWVFETCVLFWRIHTHQYI